MSEDIAARFAREVAGHKRDHPTPDLWWAE